MGTTFAGIAESGPLLLAIGVAAIAGLVSFLSPCVLPLVPGYLSYVTGLAGADLDSASASAARRGRVLAGTLLFVAGFATVFVLANVLLASAGRALLRHQRVVEIVVGVVILALGAAFAGLLPGLQREWRIRRLPAAGLLGAPVFGAVFALSWSPCLGPTLGVVLGLSAVGGDTGRAVILAFAYCAGLGAPFVAFGLGFRRMLGVFRAIRRNSMWITRVGGVLLIVVGVALVTGGWLDFVNWLRATVGVGEVSI
ncbi:cytochrome c biogenesis CcdA family protein [Planosporangium mesophilum]|uniref:cytochrome c biogenesis CcdA family protein n=1 Tax=Planosporangium mesophilum TaxID=689768 RepID=UPI001438B5FB|nr:cytochrome c biogenesis protein CcdA [Planosporangium mesophilum]NJC82099.1 cytochrome c biogenesis protein CcdA [Planosporangium mesophilum]